MVHIAYVCDRCADGCGKRGCGRYCWRTANPEHAVFGAVEEPWKYPWRFKEIKPGKWYELDPVGFRRVPFTFLRLLNMGRRFARKVRVPWRK